MWHSADDAMKWAYSESVKSRVKMSGINNMRGGGRTTLNELLIGLSPNERNNQAVNIIALAASLADKASAEYIGAWYGDKREPKHLKIIIDRMFSALGTGLHNRRAVYACVQMHFGQKPSYRVIKRILHCSDTRALFVRGQISDALDVLHHRAISDITDCLERRGLIHVAACM